MILSASGVNSLVKELSTTYNFGMTIYGYRDNLLRTWEFFLNV